jgi:hypothetical protein
MQRTAERRRQFSRPSQSLARPRGRGRGAGPTALKTTSFAESTVLDRRAVRLLVALPCRDAAIVDQSSRAEPCLHRRAISASIFFAVSL